MEPVLMTKGLMAEQRRYSRYISSGGNANAYYDRLSGYIRVLTLIHLQKLCNLKLAEILKRGQVTIWKEMVFVFLVFAGNTEETHEKRQSG
jgi:hypothetical protein